MSKGSKPRISDKKRFDENYDAIFRARKEFEKDRKSVKFNGGDNRK